MSRHGYNEDIDDQWSMIRWRGAVASAIRGRKGQAFLAELAAAIDAVPERKLVAKDFEADGAVCALSAVAVARGIDVAALELDPDDEESARVIADALAIPDSLALEIVFENDEGGPHDETPEQRHARMLRWIKSLIKAK